MVICTRARYENRPLHGVIRVSLFLGKRPVEYSMTLYDENKGLLALSKEKFSTIEEAKGAASLQGFSLLHWDETELEV